MRVICLLFLWPLSMLAQPLDSRLGAVHTPEGDLHILMIFVRYENVDLMRGSKDWPNLSEDGALPRMAQGPNNALFYADTAQFEQGSHQRNISDYYYRMSGGKFRITGDIFPVQVPIRYVGARGRNFFQRQGNMNQAAVNWIAEHYPDFDWSRYDRRTNAPNYRRNNQASDPDGILDYVIFMHRARGSGGMSSPSNVGIPGSKLRIQHGHTGLTSYPDAKHNWEYFKHEFSHTLYSAPHYLGANSADGTRFYTQKGWGLMSAWHAPFFAANAWECWWLGWLKAQEITQSGRYQLRDFVTGRDAIRIPIPGSEDYLWIENHQKRDPWDEKLFFKDARQGHPQSAPGIYMYVVAAPGADRSQPRLSAFNKDHVNLIRLYNGEGNFDWQFTGDSLHTGYFDCPLVEAVAPNPIAGQNAFQFIRADFDHNGKIWVGRGHGNRDRGGREQQDIWTELRAGKPIYTLASTGDENDALGTGDKVGLSGRFPALNYPTYDPNAMQLAPYLLNGLQIEIGERDAEGTFSLDISFDAWALSQSQRWCGNLRLPVLADSAKSPGWLHLDKKVDLRLDLSGTPDRQEVHPVTGTFANPTRLSIASGRGLRISRKASLVLERFSELHLEDGAELVIERGGRLIIGENCLLKLGQNSRLRVSRGGTFILAQGARLEGATQANVQWAKKAKLQGLETQTFTTQP